MTPHPSLPARLCAGDTLLVEQTLAEWPSPAWTLHWRATNALGVIALDAAPAAGGAHRLEVAAAVTAAWTPGAYRWQQWASDGTARVTFASGALEILPDIAALAAGYDARTPARRALDDARRAFADWIASDGHVTEYRIGERTLRFASKDELLARIQWLEREVAREEASERLAAGLGARRRLLVRF